MKTEKGKYYIVYEGSKLVIDLGLQESSVILETLKDVYVADKETDYNSFLSKLEGGEDGIQ